jgi:ribosomal protein S27AE
MMRLTGDAQLTCNDCGSVFMVRQEYQVNLQPVKFCPQCGTSNLTIHKAPLEQMLKASCFSGVDGRLVQMLFSVWATDDELKRMYPRFVDYLSNELKYG